jgi:hypothetical protein
MQEDLSLSLKLEQKDHLITKSELEHVQSDFDSYKQNMNSMIELRISEIKNIHLIEKEHLKNRLQLSEIKCKNLSIQYDDLLVRTMDNTAIKNNDLEDFLMA